MTRVYKYWAEPIDRPATVLLMQQLKRAAIYRRELTRLENLDRALVRSLLSMDLPVDERKAWNETISRAHAAALRAARTLATTPLPDGTPGLAWGSYQMVEDAADRAQRTTKLGKDVGGPTPPDQGIVAIHIQNRVVNSQSIVGGEDSFVQIGGDLYGKVKRNGTSGAPRLRELRLRVGTDGDRKPIWARLHVLMHRELPDARLRWTFVTCTRVGMRHRWTVNFVVDETPTELPKPILSETCGVDIGWRNVPGGIRVAYWWATDGQEGSLVIPETVTGRAAKSDSLRSIRDRERDEVKALLLGWRKTLPETSWFSVETQMMHSWLRIGRFVQLFHKWKEARFEGDGASFERVEAWLAHDRHLYNWEAHNRRRMTLQVMGRIQTLVVFLAKRYRTIAVEERGMVPELIEKDEPVDPSDWQRGIAARRVGIVAPGAVRSELVRFVDKYGGTLVEIDPAFTTRDCANCGHRRDAGPEWAELVVSCPSCGLAEDQDRTAARNLASGALAAVQAGSLESRIPRPSAKKQRARRTRKRSLVEPLENTISTPGSSE